MTEEQNKRLDAIADQIRILALEVQILCDRLDAAEKQEQQYKKAIESLWNTITLARTPSANMSFPSELMRQEFGNPNARNATKRLTLTKQ